MMQVTPGPIRSFPTFPERFKYARQLSGLTQVELARDAHCSRRYVIGIEHGEYVPSLKILTRLAAALHVPLEYLRGTSG